MKKSNLRTGLTLFIHTQFQLLHRISLFSRKLALFFCINFSLFFSEFRFRFRSESTNYTSLQLLHFPNRSLELANPLPMATEKLMATSGPRYVQMKSSPPSSPPTADISSSLSFRHSAAGDMFRIFDELPKATIISVSRPDPSDISPMQLSYTIEVEYKQVRFLFLFFSFRDFVELFKNEEEESLIASSEANCVN